MSLDSKARSGMHEIAWSIIMAVIELGSFVLDVFDIRPREAHGCAAMVLAVVGGIVAAHLLSSRIYHNITYTKIGLRENS